LTHPNRPPEIVAILKRIEAVKASELQAFNRRRPDFALEPEETVRFPTACPGPVVRFYRGVWTVQPELAALAEIAQIRSLGAI
jgi:hypothetical protein